MSKTIFLLIEKISQTDNNTWTEMNELQHYFCTSLIETFLTYTMLIMKGVEATEGKQEAAIQRRTDNTMVKRQGIYRQIMWLTTKIHRKLKIEQQKPHKKG